MRLAFVVAFVVALLFAIVVAFRFTQCGQPFTVIIQKGDMRRAGCMRDIQLVLFRGALTVTCVTCHR